MKEQRVEMSASDWSVFEADLDLFFDRWVRLNRNSRKCSEVRRTR